LSAVAQLASRRLTKRSEAIVESAPAKLTSKGISFSQTRTFVPDGFSHLEARKFNGRHFPGAGATRQRVNSTLPVRRVLRAVQAKWHQAPATRPAVGVCARGSFESGARARGGGGGFVPWEARLA